ncbi:MAG: phospho-sugar mutase [Aerococcus sp.]|nr:phospho-sugar mutase [Aerococcus sp.]
MGWKETYEAWKTANDLDPQVKADLDSISGDEAALADAFYQAIDFGTAGMRGLMGAGINRMNIYTVRLATEGLARLMEAYGAKAVERGVAIAYDGRHHSLEFALESAKVLGNHGIKTYVFEGVRPTPELSYAVRHLKTYTGIMITASHNTKEYNGYKVYGEDGGQMTPEDAAALTNHIKDVDPLTIPVADLDQLKADGLYQVIGTDVDNDYLDQVEKVTIDHDIIKEVSDEVSIVYTPLQGTGQLLVEQAFERAGFKQVIYIDEQREPNADFSTLKSPNPEEASAFEYAMAYGKKNHADVLIATDPDADRMGVGVKMPDGEYRILTGNQIGALLTQYILTARSHANDLPENSVIVKSIVSSELPAAITKHFQVGTVNTLTGFKFIAEQIKNYEKTGEHTFVFGFEESYGFLIQPFVRDKDAVQTAVLFAELAAYYKKQGKTPYDGLLEIFQTYGHYAEKTLSVKLSGQEGAMKIAEIMSGLRSDMPSAIAGVAVETVEDYQNATRYLANGETEPIAIEKANVLKFYLADRTWIAVRPSGTEPKIKFYIGTVAADDEAAQQQISQYEAFVNQFAD